MTFRNATNYEKFQWLRYRRNSSDPGLTLSYQFRLLGTVDPERLNHALRKAISTQFQTLLSFFFERNNILFAGRSALPDKILEQVQDKECWNNRESIDPAGDKLFRFTYFLNAADECLFKLEFSHIVFDGECYQPFLKVLSRCWINSPMSQDTAVGYPEEAGFDDSSMAYWQESLAGARLFQPLSFCYKTPKDDGVYLSVKKNLDGAEFAAISALLERRHVSLFQFILSVTSALIGRYDPRQEGRHPVVIAHTVNCRHEGQPYGCYTNLIPLLVNVDCSEPGTRLLEQVRWAREAVRPHQTVPTLTLLAAAGAEENHGGRLLNLVVNSSDGLVPHEPLVLEGVAVEWEERPETGGPVDLAVNYSCDGQQINLSFDSSSCRLGYETLAALAENFVRMASFIACHPDVPLRSCDFGRPLAPVMRGQCQREVSEERLLSRFMSAAGRHRDETAVSDEQHVLSYGQVLQCVEELCTEIAAQSSLLPDGSVGVFMERCAALPAAYLGAIAAQLTFVPMDPLLPDERLRYMGDATDMRMLLVAPDTRQRAAALFPDAALIELTGAATLQRAAGHARSLAAAQAEATARPAERAAYILFTSGSTGRPKGVAISERSLMNFLHSMSISPGFGAGERMLALTPVSFDISMLELLLPLMCGGNVHVLSDTTRVSAALLGEAINQRELDLVQATPSTWRILQQAEWRAARPFTVLCGGEALDTGLAEYLLEQTGLLYNMYGPTEATIWASSHRVIDPRRISLGYPVLNSDFYILDSAGGSVAQGMQGELVIAGACVGLGYVNTDNDTAFVTLANGVRAYKTGDVVSSLSLGQIEFHGRRDSQSKVNGYRIDTAEISHRVNAFSPDATVFTVVRNKPEPHVCCFLWLPDDENVDEAAALCWCKRTLPYYMVPKAIRLLSYIPLTANGKADTRLLREAAWELLPLRPATAVEPRRTAKGNGSDDVRLALQRMLKERLGVDVADFHQPLGWLGLNSISYNLLSAEIMRQFNARLQSHEFYQFNSIDEIAGAIRHRIAPECTGGIEKNDDYRLSLNAHDGRLAIVGMSAAMPGGNDADDFWRALLGKEDCVGGAPAKRRLPGCHGGFLPDVQGFDARFFSVSPLEATCMDPRQRLLMQAAWRALEDAGYAPSALGGGRIGCYMAATGMDYALLQARYGTRQTPYSLAGHSQSMLANRISAFFDWYGPSFTLDTACSGALTALVKACRDLQGKICDGAMVGGINLILDSQIESGLAAGGFMSPNQRCATFDQSADGYARGEGYGCFFIKRLEDATADGDCIHAVIESAAENHGGKANSLTAPNPNAQYRLFLDAYTPELARRVSYLETHGSGTPLGDPIEMNAIKRAWKALVAPESAQTVWLGAVKTNIGHLESAAGIASVVKVIKAFEHRTLPANLHYRRLNPDIDLTATPFRVLEETTAWRGSEPLTAGVSAFGFGGSNAHVVLSAPAPQAWEDDSPNDRYLLPVSARTETALQNMVESLAGFVESRCHGWKKSMLLHLAYTLSCGREHFEHRQAWLASGFDNLLEQLRAYRGGVPIRRHTPVEDGDTGHDLGDINTLARLQSLYLQGGKIDWRRLYLGAGAKKIPLPTYRFDVRDYWFSMDKKESAHAHTRDGEAESSQVHGCGRELAPPER